MSGSEIAPKPTSAEANIAKPMAGSDQQANLARDNQPAAGQGAGNLEASKTQTAALVADGSLPGLQIDGLSDKTSAAAGAEKTTAIKANPTDTGNTTAGAGHTGDSTAANPNRAIGDNITVANPTGAGDASDSAVPGKTYQLGDGTKGHAPDPEVKTIQQKLTDLNYPTNGVDGEYGAGTQKAVTDFQNANGLPATGKVDQATLAKLTGPDATKNPAAAQNADGSCKMPTQAEINKSWADFAKTGQVDSAQPGDCDYSQPAATTPAPDTTTENSNSGYNVGTWYGGGDGPAAPAPAPAAPTMPYTAQVYDAGGSFEGVETVIPLNY
jgi:peptidoglycan hydrolase-like protein with peptidoglycan-binding domain